MISGWWEATPGTWHAKYESWEFIHLIEGAAIITPDGGEPVEELPPPEELPPLFFSVKMNCMKFPSTSRVASQVRLEALHCRAHSRAKAHSAKENEADAAANIPDDDPRREKSATEEKHVSYMSASVDI